MQNCGQKMLKSAGKFFKSILTVWVRCGKIKERRKAFLPEWISGGDGENEDREVMVWQKNPNTQAPSWTLSFLGKKTF
jgi:hypothetical protein